MRFWKQRGPRPLSFEAFGVQLELTLGEDELLAEVQDILPPGWQTCEASGSAGRFALRRTENESYEVTANGVPSMHNGRFDLALGMLDAQMRAHIAANAPEMIFVHAGVVAIDGRAMLIPGESFSGKTTLVRALVEAGAEYYSDEYAPLDADGRVHPYPRRLSIRGPGGTSTERMASELGGTIAEKSAEVATVILSRYRAKADWQPRPLSTGEGVLALFAHTAPAKERPQESLRALHQALKGATVLQGDRGEADALAPRLLDQQAAVSAAGPSG